MPFETHMKNGLVWLTSSLLDGTPHGFSTRPGGVSAPPWDTLNLGPSRGDDPAAVAENYRRFCAVTKLDPARLVMSRQVHETTVRICTADDCGKGLSRERNYTADALVTNEPALPLVVFSADCGLILPHDPACRAVGAVHAGWRGCAAGIVEKAVQTMSDTYGSDPAHIRAALGPCIGQCCFETDDNVADAMTDALGADAAPFLERRGAKWHVDLAGLNRRWLLKAGLSEDRIDLSGLCTACRPDLFWSHRKMGEQRGLQVGAISLPGGDPR